MWWSSLPLRVVLTTLLASALVMLLGGLLLLQRATAGVSDAKTTSALAESQAALDIARQRLAASAGSTDSVDQRLTQVALDIRDRGALSQQYQVVAEARAARIQNFDVFRTDPVPATLRETMAHAQPGFLYYAPTLIRYVDGRGETPGLVVSALLEAEYGGPTLTVYFVFPLITEAATLRVLQQATGLVGSLLTVALALVSYLVARTVVKPVRRAALTAEKIAAGGLDERLPVKGTDDIAVLAASMNNMALQLDKQIKSYEELSRVQQRFVSDVSHELRTPLTTVRMAAEVLYDGRDDFDPVVRRSTELLHDELDRFESLLADLLEISRFDAGAAVLALDETTLEDIVRSEVAAELAFAERKGTPISIEVRGDTSAQMDSRRIQRILRNLLTNAIEHGEGKPIQITVAGDEHAVAVTVRDHGVGFEAANVSQVFERFWRADPSRAREVGGTGLGLSIAREDASLHGGWLHAWGRPGQGAQFRLTLPRTPGHELTISPLTIAPEDLANGGTA